MHWGIYDFCAVLSGVIMVGAAALEKGGKPKDRVWALASGLGLLIYGFYVAQQSSGAFVFPAAMFAIPIGLGGRALYRLYHQSAAIGASSNRSETQSLPSEASLAFPPKRSGATDADAS